MIRKGNGYVLDSGREIPANEGLLCPMDSGVLAEGYDGTVDQSWGDDPDCDAEPALTEAERKEIAMHMIARWLTWAGAMPAGCTLHPTALETCDMCPRVDLHLNVSLTRGAVASLMSKGGTS